ncbi:hypothetical protein HHL21_14420 [Massilia sp. RP-1-19]|uniref:Uncharacterized protein n=1 Tax=Massilia polaris TaxID=2728846 RepID=A0A848HU90_9BURK|nr:hypothetical protein [Massilia polaris]NML62248.1 hypothetical protein [Massilia polaris]
MTATTATRRAAAPPRTTPPGTGHLHQALEDARDLAVLRAFCRTHNCPPEAVSGDGVRLDMLRVFDLMRSLGYDVSPPKRPQHQPKKGFTTWLIDVTTPNGTSLQMGFATPNTS